MSNLVLPFSEHGLITVLCEKHVANELATKRNMPNGIQYRYDQHSVYLTIYHNGTVMVQGDDNNARKYYDKIIKATEHRNIENYQ